MKVLRAIGGFFAKIGRWIANTAWIQPLLIVGGIFGIIFSIPYIKSAIEAAQVDNTDYDYQYYTNHSLGLSQGGSADKLLGYLENEQYDKIDDEFAPKFFLTFAKSECPNCKSGVEGWKAVEAYQSKYETSGFKLYTIIVDEKDDNDSSIYLAKNLFKENHQKFLDNLDEAFGEDTTNNYALYRNDTTNASTIKDAFKKLSECTSADSEGLQTPMTFMYDSAKRGDHYSMFGITAVFLNYIDLIKTSETGAANVESKAQLLRNCWNYSDIFDPEYSNKK